MSAMADQNEQAPSSEFSLGRRLSSFADRRGVDLVLSLAAGLHCGRLEIELPDGTRRVFEGAQDGPHATLRLRNGRLARMRMYQQRSEALEAAGL